MGLLSMFGFGRKSWKDADAKKRLAGVQDVPRTDQATLLNLALQDSDSAVRQAAARRLKQASALEKLLVSSDATVQGIAQERLAGVAVAEVKRRPLAEAIPYLKTISEQSSLVEISLQAQDVSVQRQAFDKLCACAEPSGALLARVAIQHANEVLALEAVALVSKRQLLKDVSKKAKCAPVRAAAAAIIQGMVAEQGQPSAEKQRRQRKQGLEPLLERIQVLAGSTRFDDAQQEITDCVQQWADCLAAYDDLAHDAETSALCESFERAQQRFNERREAVETAAALFASSAQALKTCHAAWVTRCASVETQADCDALRNEALAEWTAIDGNEQHEDALRAFTAIFVVGAAPVPTSAASTSHDAGTPEETVPAVVLSDEAQAQVEAVLVEAASLLTCDDWKEADYRFKELHKIWHGHTIDLSPRDPLRTRFNEAYSAFKNLGYERREQQRSQQGQRVELLTELVAEARVLATEDTAELDVQQRLKSVQDIQQRWKAVGSVPQSKVHALRTEFRALCDTAYAPVQVQRDAQREKDEWKGLEDVQLAEELIGKVEALLTRDDHEQILVEVKGLQQAWRTIKRLPRKKNEALWPTFKAAADAVFDKLQPYFVERDVERMTHYDSKQVLLEELQALLVGDADGAGSRAEDPSVAHEGVASVDGVEGTESTVGSEVQDQRQQRSERVKQIQQAWKDIGPVPREKDAEQWQAYRAALDVFFGRRRKNYENRAEEQTENLHQKLAILAEISDLAEDAEAWKKGEKTDVKESDLLRMVKELQQSWKNIGHIPKDKVEDMWTRFRAYCDRVFTCLKDYFDAMDVARQENLQAKRALLQQIQVISESEDPAAQREAVKELQTAWRAIGHIPREAMNEVNAAYQSYCDIVFNVSRSIEPQASADTTVEVAVESATETTDTPDISDTLDTAVPDTEASTPEPTQTTPASAADDEKPARASE